LFDFSALDGHSAQRDAEEFR